MIIILKIDDLLFNLFPASKEGRKEGRKEGLDSLKEELIKYYTFGPYKPNVEIKDDFVQIEIDASTITHQKSDFDTAVRHCETGNFGKAKPILEKLINSNPTVSEYHRILGQIYSIQGKQDEAINHLINALRWDPKNTHALTMMGNIHAREKNDIKTALTYYEHALAVKPEDHIAMNNMGANLMQLGRVREAEGYFEKALSINNSYPNTLYALGMIKDGKEDHIAAFDFAIQALKKSNPSNPLHGNAFELAIQASRKYVKNADATDIFNEYSHRLAIESGKVIDVLQDDTIPTHAKLEMAENYARDKHTVKFKKDSPAIDHLIMHELVHLDFTTRCRKRGINYLFIASKENKERFIRDHESTIQRLSREGVEDKAIADFMNALFDGMNSQIFNTPTDLFIEDFLSNTFTGLRPFQFLSLLSLLKEYIDAATSRKIIEYTPLKVKNANVILSLVNSFQFTDMYGYEMSHLFKATSPQIKLAKEFYSDYLKYLKSDKAVDSHELIKEWAAKLKVDQYFVLVKENEYRSLKSQTGDMLEEPVHFIKPDSEPGDKARIDYSKEPVGQAAVTMYCLSALQFFKDMELAEIQKVGFEIGILGQQGIDPSKQDKKYFLKSIPGKEFSGLQLLAYMYVAFQFIDPALDTGLNFRKEYLTAKDLYEKQ